MLHFPQTLQDFMHDQPRYSFESFQYDRQILHTMMEFYDENHPALRPSDNLCSGPVLIAIIDQQQGLIVTLFTVQTV